MSASWPPDVDLLDVIEPWLRTRRWFPGDDTSELELLENIDLSQDSAPAVWDGSRSLEPVWISLLRVGTAVLQVPLVLTDTRPVGAAGVIDRVAGAWLVDGPQHPAFLRAWARRAQCDLGDPDTLTPGILEQAGRAHLLTGEQSNSSVLLPGPAPRGVLKVFRVIAPGTHPDLEVPLALARSGWGNVPAPLAHTEVRVPDDPSSEERRGGPAVSGILARLVEDARDGFQFFVSLATGAEDPTGQARELGAVTARMHDHLAEIFGRGVPGSGSALADRITGNLRAAAAEVPELADDLVDRLSDTVARVADLGELPPPIRIHGDYHLGQTLLGSEGWFVLDFEGEPLRPLEERRRHDLALRDVAGMLRSFDYARAQAGRDPSSAPRHPNAATTAEFPPLAPDTPASGSGGPTDGRPWCDAAQSAFLDGYTDGHGLGGVNDVLVRALMVEKAAYELVYEHRLRPSWISIPLDALRDLAAEGN